MMTQLLLALIVALAAQASPVPAAPTQFPVPATTLYQIGPSDVLGIKVFEEPTLSGEYNVDTDGTITFPFLGRVMVSGKTIKDIEAEITAALRADYVRRAQVSVDITQYRSRAIYVLGEVRSPGKYSIEGQVTLLEVIAKAGSLTPTAGPILTVLRSRDGTAAASTAALEPAVPGDPRGAELLRISYDDLREGRLKTNILLQDGDTIFVPAADKFYVSGFVRTPGMFVLTPGLTVQQAISLAGGLTDRGSDRGIKISRKVNGKDVEVGVKMSDPIKPNDTIKVRQRKI
jgi:polysaccharide export outer membrane protein